MKTTIVPAVLMLLISPVLAHAGSGTNGVVHCWNKEQDEISLSCNIKQAGDGSGAGSCVVSTFRGGWKGPRVNWILEGHIKPLGGSHPIAKKEKSLSYAYSPGEFGCAISPPPGYTYTVGDCTIDENSAAEKCTVNIQSEGSNKYYQATAVAKPY
jgi:hypothetical protein